MKAFLSGIALMIIIAVAAWATLDRLPYSSAERQATDGGSLRLDSAD